MKQNKKSVLALIFGIVSSVAPLACVFFLPANTVVCFALGISATVLGIIALIISAITYGEASMANSPSSISAVAIIISAIGSRLGNLCIAISLLWQYYPQIFTFLD